jgi:predicted transcriptional regulator
LQEQQLLETKGDVGLSLGLSTWSHESLVPLTARRNQRKAVRSQIEIEASILESCRTANVQHWVMVKARLGYDTFWKHMNYLLSNGLMDERFEGSRTLYQTSTRGLELLAKLSGINDIVNGF